MLVKMGVGNSIICAYLYPLTTGRLSADSPPPKGGRDTPAVKSGWQSTVCNSARCSLRSLRWGNEGIFYWGDDPLQVLQVTPCS